MPQPDLKPNDVFLVFGFKAEDPYSDAPQRLKQCLEGHPGGEKLIEVYSLSKVNSPEHRMFRAHSDYESFYFYNKAASELTVKFGIHLPPRWILKFTRNEFPPGLATYIQMTVA